MKLHTENRYHVVFFLSREELETLGLDEDQSDWTHQLKTRVMDEMGDQNPGLLEIEAYPGQCGVMVFASLSPDSVLDNAFFAFHTLDDVIALCALLPHPPKQSALARFEGKYILSLVDTGARMAPLCRITSEFAERLYRPLVFLSFLTDQELMLVPRDAVQKLCRLC